MNNFADPLSVLEVHLDAVARNWLSLKKKLKNGTDCAGVVKADGYGLGSVQVAETLYDQGCRHFFVAHYKEALPLSRLHALHVEHARERSGEGREQSLQLKEISLITHSSRPSPQPSPVNGRGGGADAPLIYVLNGPHGASAQDFIHHNFIPVLNSPADIEYWADKAAGKPCIIHIDTGMNRLGLGSHDVKTLAEKKDILDKLDIRYVMSHLSCGDEPAHPMNSEQLRLFEKLTAVLQKPLRLSFANSGGIFLGPDYHFDLVRPGCALYGINPTAGPNPMQGTVTLKAKILQIREIENAGTVGYGASYKVAPPAKTATISVGYADGYLRSLTGKGAVFINSVKCPVIGRVSMDTIIVDVSHVGHASGMHMNDFGDGYAEIIGTHQTVDEVAAQAGTIGYEILTNLGKRYKRIYGS